MKIQKAIIGVAIFLSICLVVFLIKPKAKDTFEKSRSKINSVNKFDPSSQVAKNAVSNPKSSASAELIERAQPTINTKSGLTDTGLLSHDLIDVLRLTTEEQLAVNGELSKWKNKLTELIKINIVNLSAGRPEGAPSAFQIKSFPEAGAETINEFNGAVSKIVGTERSEIILKSINTFDRFAAYGQHSAYIEFHPISDSSQEEFALVSIVEKDRNGVIKRQTETTLSDVNSRYGTSFQIGK